MSKVALIIIYNHQYNKNIDIIERIYSKRFSNIYHLVPFYNGDKNNVIPVYESSFYFNGYVAQGCRSFFREEFEHYFFIGDDLILNPAINENSYKAHLKLKNTTCFIPRISALSENPGYWPVNLDSLIWELESGGVEAKNQFPTHQQALERLKYFGVQHSPLKFEQIWKTPANFKEWRSKIIGEKFYHLRKLKYKITKKQYYSFYPLVRSYSDIFVVSANTIKLFCHYCGVFAATRLFVELALPTSLVFSATEINTEKDLELKGRALWTKEDLSILDKFDLSLKNFLEDFPEGHLYIHPVKLSKWNTDL